MAKLCPECASMSEDSAPYCEACGCQFSKHPANPVTETSRWKYLSVVIFVVVIASYLAFGKGCGAG